MRIQNNIMAMNAYRNYSNNTSALSKNLEKLSSGYKINRAGDDAAGLAISEKMRAQITGLDKAQDNANDGISLVQTAEGALTEVHDMLNRMYELAEQSANGTYDQTDRDQLQKEITALSSEINRIADTANFNDIKLFTGGETLDTSVPTASIDTTNAAKLGANTKFAFDGAATDEQKAAFNEALGESGTAITVGLNIATGTSLAANDTVKLSNLPTGYTFKFTDQTDAAADVADGTAINVGTGVGKLDVSDVTTAVTFDVYDDADNKVGTFTVDVSSLTGITTGAEQTSTVTLGGTNAAAGGTGDEINIPAGEIWLQIGEDASEKNRIQVNIGKVDTTALNIADIDISSQSGALNALSKIENAIDQVSGVRGDLGAVQNRLEHTINNLGVMEENIQNAESSIRDTDVAEEMMDYTKNNILIQSAQAMLAQANQVPQGVLQLLQ